MTPTSYTLTIKATGITKAAAVTQALRLLAEIVESPGLPRYSTGCEHGTGEAKLEEVNEVEP